MRLELAWGGMRRALLKTLWPGFVRRMRETRRGEDAGYPHEILDPRDLKFYQNRPGYWWDKTDDPFAWRDRLPFARVGLCELFVLSTMFFSLAGALALVHWSLSVVASFLGLCIVWFFRNPRRQVPTSPALVVSPADGTIVEILELPEDDFIGGKAVRIGIFLSVFNVHINRVPFASRVVGMTYRRGKFLNALLAASARENEQLEVRIQQTAVPHRPARVRQIAGAIARRIVCWAKPGDEFAAGDQFGMIKLGSRTELVIPHEAAMQIRCKIGDKVQAGSSVLVEYQN